MSDRCVHGMIVRYCATCQKEQERRVVVANVAPAPVIPSNEDIKLQLEIKAAAYISKAAPHAVRHTKKSSEQGNKVFGDYAIVAVRDAKKPDFLSHVRENITIIHLDGHPFLWILELIVQKIPHLKQLRVTPLMRAKMGPTHLNVLQKKKIELTEGYHRPEMAWKEGENRSSVYDDQRQFIRHLISPAKELFEELLRRGFDDAEMVARYFCIKNEPFIPQREIAKMYGYEGIGSNSHASRKILAVLHLLDPVKFVTVSKDALRHSQAITKELEEGRKLLVETARQQKFLEEIELAELPSGISWESASLPFLRLVRLKYLSGELDRLKTFDPRDHQIIVQRYGIEDGIFRTLEEVAQPYGLTRERIRQLELRALKKLGIPVE